MSLHTATAAVEISVGLSHTADGAPNTLVVYDWFSYGAQATPPRGGNEVEVLIDGEAAWSRVHDDLQHAQQEVRLATWMLRADTELLRPIEHTLQPPETRADARFGTLVEQLAARGIPVRVLIWGMTYSPLIDPWLRRWYWRVPANIDVLEHDHPVLIGSHHQKTLTIDGRVGYCGGMNLKENDWDTPDHAVFDPRRSAHHTSPARRRAVAGKRQPSEFPPRHDLVLRIEGPAVGDLDTNFTQRWDRARRAWHRSPVAWIAALWRRLTGRRLPPELQPRPAPRAKGDTFVQIVRTRPKARGGLLSAPPAEDSILDAYRRAIGNARRYVYIENQYFRSPLIGEALAEAIERVPSLRIIVVAWPINDGKKSWFNPSGYWTAHTQNLLRAAQRKHRPTHMPQFTLSRVMRWDRDHTNIPTLCQIDVHAKVMIIDDIWLTVGSANINDRGFKYESELNAVVLNAAHATELRCRLMAEHLEIEPDDPRLADVDTAFTLWAEHGSANPDLFDRGKRPMSRVHHFLQEAPPWPPFGIGRGIF
jgi:phosphatidylserine/phosphatidylglycerophosphate/cardiolipin synthase-like enzyme